MLLSPKHTHRLRKELAEIISNESDARMFCNKANLNVSRINFKGTPWDMWGNIIGKVIRDQAKMLNLLERILLIHKDNEVFAFYYNEILSSKKVRLSKLAAALKQKKCVVFLGPDILKVSQNNTMITFNEHLCSILEEKMEDQLIYFDKRLKTNLSYMAQCFADSPMYVQGDTTKIAAETFQKLYNKRQIDKSFFEELSNLPLKLVVNANPDTMLYDCLVRKGVNSVENAYYNIANFVNVTLEQQDAVTLNERPINDTDILVYNIFGSFEKLDSVLFTESQFLDFINRVLTGNPRLHPDVLRLFNENDSYLFLGFDFEQWYFKILFQLFGIKKDQYASVSCGFEAEEEPDQNLPYMNPRISVYTREFFEQEFKMFFVNDDIKNFIIELANLI